MNSTNFENEEEYAQDALLSLAYLIIGLFAGWRLFSNFSTTGSGKVITLFFFLITITAIIRSIWFIIPSSTLEGTYSPQPMKAFESTGWKGLLLSEILLAIGSLGLYAVFLLVVCYWAHMLQKVEQPENIETNYLQQTPQRQKRGPMEKFALMMLFLTGLEALNIILFVCRFYNSEAMILFDSLLFSLTSLATLIAISMFSNRLRVVLTMMGMINGNSTKPQVRRILAITIAANIFFIFRLLVELSVALYLISLWTAKKSFYVIISDIFWSRYIVSKHWSEICVLGLELIISTSTKSNAPPQPTTSTSEGSARKIKKKKNPARRPNETELLKNDFDDEKNYHGVAV